MNATKNDVSRQYEVQRFPTVYFTPKNSKTNPRKYEGTRTVDDFIEYLVKEATEPLNSYDCDGLKEKDKKTMDDEL